MGKMTGRMISHAWRYRPGSLAHVSREIMANQKLGDIFDSAYKLFSPFFKARVVCQKLAVLLEHGAATSGSEHDWSFFLFESSYIPFGQFNGYIELASMESQGPAAGL